MSRAQPSVLPEPLPSLIVRFGEKLKHRKPLQPELGAVLTGLGQLPPEAVVRADREVGALARMWWQHPPERSLLQKFFPKPSEPELLRHTHDLEYLFLFHGDGRLRQAALLKMAGGAPNAFFFAAIAWRLNDWAPPVREAAGNCASRVFPATDPAVIAEAALFLLDRARRWQRWKEEAAILSATLARPDVARHLAGLLATGRSGPLGALLRYALQREGIDPYLPDLASKAFLPTVRAVALQSLIERCATWHIGFERRWVDKSFNITRRVAVFGSREFPHSRSVQALIAEGARDKSALVRKVAASGLIRHRSSLENVDPIIEALAADKNRAVRERAEFILRERAGDAAAVPRS